MDSKSLKKKTIKGVVWSGIDRFSGQAIQFILGLILARLLSPSDFGIIGMITIFIAVSEAIIDSGFGNALIQKQGRNQTDYSTVFYFNTITGIILYTLMFVAAPYIASFYGKPILKDVTRVVSINLIVNSLMIVQTTKLTIELNFKLQTKIRVFSSAVSGIIAVLLAYNGYGVWALVFQMVATQVLICILLWISAKWSPSLVFSKHSFKKLFNFGSKLLITGLYGPIFNNLNTLIIGKLYSSNSLGFYTRAYQFAQFPSYNISQIISRVSFPVLSSIQNDDERLKKAYRKLIKDTYFVVFPLMFGLALISDPLIRLLLTEKWMGCVLYMKILCLSLTFFPICSYNINLLLVKGRSGLHLKLDLIKKLFTLIVLLITAFISIEAICFGTFATTIFSWIITAIYSGKLINLNLASQIKDILPSFICTIGMSIIVYLLSTLALPDHWLILVEIAVGSISYIILSCLFNKSLIKPFFEFIKLRI